MSTDAPENPRETENEEPDEKADANAENEPKADDQNDQPEAGAEENEKPKKGFVSFHPVHIYLLLLNGVNNRSSPFVSPFPHLRII